MKKHMHLFMLVLLALLQGVAPLAHAHVNGHSEDHHVHLAGLDLHHSLAQQQASDAALEEDGHVQVVGMQPEFRGKQIELAAGLPTAALRMPDMPARLVTLVSPPLPVLFFPLIPYLHPASQAPPA